MKPPIPLDGSRLGLAELAAIARSGRSVTLADGARTQMEASCAWVERAARGELTDTDGEPLAVYGVNTGFGSLARIRIPSEKSALLSWNLMRSHAAGVGKAAPDDVVRAMMALRANALAKGASGCRPLLVDTLCAMLDRGVIPEVPLQGSCGSSGDLAPLAHLALVMFRAPAGGEDGPNTGWARLGGQRMAGADAMTEAGLERLVPAPKDGLAITNGAQLTTAIAALAAWDASELVLVAEIAAAMSWEAIRGVTRALHPGVHALRPYRGAIDCAANLRTLLEGSSLVDSLPDKVQDAYSIRCTPQILGAVRDGLRYASGQIQVELNAATDNPLILLDVDDPNKAFSAGMFHGEPIGLAADHLKLSVSELAALAERRIYRLTTGTLSSRLPPLLRNNDRPDLGMMVPQTTAASLVAANRALAWPSSADSLPTCEDQEDIVAMSTTAARTAREIVDNSRKVVAIELLTAATALRHRLDEAPDLRLGRGSYVAMKQVEAALERAGELPSDAIASLDALIQDGGLLAAVTEACGPLAAAISTEPT